MSVQISLKQNNTVDEASGLITYISENEIVASEGIELQLFVYLADSDVFSHVATPYDIDSYPADRDTALLEGYTYYRRVDVTKTFTRLDIAEDFISNVQSRIQWLANVYERVADTFTGEQTYTYESES